MRLRLRWVACGWLWLTASCDDPALSPDEVEERAQKDALEQLTQTTCTGAEACECTASTAMGCSGSESDAWGARLLAGRSRGLEWDGACVDAIGDAVAAAECKRASSGTSHPCNDYCAVFHGDRELGETCDAFDEFVSDCAPGVLCSAGRCVDPCSVLSGLRVGERCSDPATGTQFQPCAQGLWCNSSVGRCAVPLPEGSACLEGGFDSACGPDAYCDWQSSICRGLPTLGEWCADSPDCAQDLFCVYDDVGYATCQARGGVGESCSGRPCVEELSCDANQVCRELAELGEPCLAIGCREGLVCDSESESNWICREAPAVGQPCPNNTCESDAWCDTATDPAAPVCVAGVANGGACSGHLQCGSDFCPKGTCEVRPALGEDCSDLFVCAAGLSCDGSTCRPSITAAPAVCVYEGW